MTESTFLLSINTSEDGDTVHIHADEEGLRLLGEEIDNIRAALAREEAPHSHLFSESWGGQDLTESMLQSERDAKCQQVHHVKLYGWSGEWKSKHGL